MSERNQRRSRNSLLCSRLIQNDISDNTVPAGCANGRQYRFLSQGD